MSSLQDQLLKAGIVDKKKANKVKKNKQQSTRSKRKSNVDDTLPDENQLQAKKLREEKVQRDKALNAQRQEEAQKKALQAQVKQLIFENTIEREASGELAYNFTDGKKIKKLYMANDMQSELAKGRLAIAKWGDDYRVIPRGVAEKIRERDEKYVLVLNDKASQDNDGDEDPYADYQIPDDLMW